MTADNTQWDYGKLMEAISFISIEKDHWGSRNKGLYKALAHAIAFIEWNMEQLEITDNNGD